MLWHKIQPSDFEAADQSLNEVAYDLINEGKYKLARVLLDFATTTLKPYLFSEDTRLRLVINLAQVYKWAGEEEHCKQTLDAEDWSAANIRFALARAVLQDDFKTANAIVQQIGNKDKQLDIHAYREWPLFKELRKSSDFSTLFEEVFGEPLNRFVMQSDEPPAPALPAPNGSNAVN